MASSNNLACTLQEILDRDIIDPVDSCNWTAFFPNSANYESPVSNHENAFTRAMRNTPRFGNTNDIGALTNGSTQESGDYYTGSQGIAIASWVFFILWVITLSYCRWKGVGGWLSGVPPRRKSTQDKDTLPQEEALTPALAQDMNNDPDAPPQLEHSAEDNAALQEEEPLAPVTQDKNDDPDAPLQLEDNKTKVENDEEAKMKKFLRQLKRCRIALLIVIPVMIVFSGLVFGQAIPGLNIFIDHMQRDLPEMILLAEDANNVTRTFLTSIDEVQQSRSDSLDFLANDCNLTAVEKLLQRRLNEILRNITFLQPRDGMKVVNESLYNATLLMEGVDETLDEVDDYWYWVVVTLMVVLDVIGVLFMVGTIMAWRQEQPRWYGKMLRYLTPVFCLLIPMFYFVSSYSLVYSVMVADFCTGTPDNQVERLIGAPPPFDKFVEWYVGGCNEDEHPTFLILTWKVLLNMTYRLQAALAEAGSSFDGDVCDAGPIKQYEILQTLSERLDTHLTLVVDMIDVMECTRFNDVYSHLAYQSKCCFSCDTVV